MRAYSRDQGSCWALRQRLLSSACSVSSACSHAHCPFVPVAINCLHAKLKNQQEQNPWEPATPRRPSRRRFVFTWDRYNNQRGLITWVTEGVSA